MNDDAGALSRRIEDAERRVVARDEALRQHWAQTRQHWHQRIQPRRWLMPAALGGAALVLTLWWLRRPRAAMAHTAAAPSRVDSAHWVRTIGLLWPLLPSRWRARVSPGAAAALASVGLPLLEKLVAGHPAPPLATMPRVDLARFMGTWHELARLPTRYEKPCVGAGSAHYTLQGDMVRVINRCRTADGGERVAIGRARVAPGSGNARLQVSFLPPLLDFLPFVWGELWIVHVDPHYRMAVVGHPNRHACWLLARESRVSPADKARLVDIAARQGFAVQHLLHVDRTG
jgi:apolipoprotein D and lipocalin family protein